jgi:DNA-binding transcriptional regulator YiaG
VQPPTDVGGQAGSPGRKLGRPGSRCSSDESTGSTSRPRLSDKNRHWLDAGRGDLPIVLGHDHDPQRFNTSAVPSEIGSIAGQHRHGWLPLLQLLQCDIRPSTPGRSFVDLPMVEDAWMLAADLAQAGIAAAQVQPPRSIDVRALRHRLGLSREQFATRFGLEVETLRNWEIGRREPDTTARSYLHAIANDPERVEQAYAPTQATTE